MLARRAPIAASVVAIAVLSGCVVGENYGPFNIAQSESGPAVIFCDSDTIESIEVLALAPGADRRDGWESVWSASGPRGVDFGEILTLDSSAAGFAETDVTNWSLKPDYEYQITVEFDDSGWFGPVFTVPADGVSQGQWLTPYGRLTDEGCAGYR